MWEFIADAIFFSLPTKVQIWCLVLAIVLIGVLVLWVLY